MTKTLVIVESPAKAKTIEKFLGRNYSVRATMGHLRDLPKSQFGVDLEHQYEPRYINIRGKGDVIKELKTLTKKADRVGIKLVETEGKVKRVRVFKSNGAQIDA